MSDKKRQEIRNEMRSILASLDARWLKAASIELSRNLNALISNHLNRNFEHVLAWTKFFPGEPDLSNFIGVALETKKVYLPRALPDWSMDFIGIGKNWGDDISAGAFGIPEPDQVAGESFNHLNGDKTIVIVPGLAFDRSGNRLGRGKGYYDRFLAREGMESSLKIGVSWSLQFVESIPVHKHDIPVDWICNERGFQKIVT